MKTYHCFHNKSQAKSTGLKHYIDCIPFGYILRWSNVLSQSLTDPTGLVLTVTNSLTLIRTLTQKIYLTTFSFNLWSRVTNYNFSLRSNPSKYSRPRRTHGRAISLTPSTTTRKQSSLLAKQSRTQLKLCPILFVVVDPTGLEPATSSVQMRRSTR
jgi:hypothetical protein